MGRGWRVELVGRALVLVDTVGDLCALASLVCDHVCVRISDQLIVETDAHRAVRERLHAP